MELFPLALIAAAFLCSLVTGFLLAYAIVIMPGIANLSDAEFLRTFQITDKVIQNNQPLFIVMWAGSAVALLAAAIAGLGTLAGTDAILLLAATIAYLLGVQLKTIIVHLPLNNTLQALQIDTLNEQELAAARREFEPRWNQSNRMRTAISAGVSLALIVLVFRAAA